MKSTYIIGEIGQNHNGSVDLAKLLVDLAGRPIKEELFDLSLRPMDAVKLTKRDLKEELSASQMEQPYMNQHSFGRTYGEHRAALELSDLEHFEVFKHAKSKGIDFIETICAIGAMSLLKIFTPDYLKIASRDLTNIPLLSALSETNIPMILSTGMANEAHLNNAIETITRYHSDISILHCTSEYPTQPQNTNLRTISYLKKKYSQYRIGYSDHTIGISIPVAAVAMGAEIIEKHITIDRRMKGTDQKGSLGPDGINRMIRDIRILEKSLGVEDIFISKSVQSAQKKLERSLASKVPIKKGQIITEDMIHMLSPGDGFKYSERHEVIDKKAITEIKINEVIYANMIKND